MEFTKGPWTYGDNPDGLPIVTKGFDKIAWIRDAGEAKGTEIDANAHLIASRT